MYNQIVGVGVGVGGVGVVVVGVGVVGVGVDTLNTIFICIYFFEFIHKSIQL